MKTVALKDLMVKKVNSYKREKVINQMPEKGKAAFSFRKHTVKRILKGNRICHPQIYRFHIKNILS